MSRDSAEGSVQQYDDEECDKATNDKQGVAPADILQEIVDRKESVVVEWYDQTNKEPPRVDAFLEPNNASKNRFKGVLLYDKSRVTIKGQKGSDYYHASLVDSLEKKDGYILAQAPFSEETEAGTYILYTFCL
ncbi:protein-tyrosine phosphatase domain-containing protein [Ditylenchus destructor]|uniref:Protein-tyrosine phosphatase domain-containing protein n=1 Tax=Ditylenchus destructor TaxID=166010 RepID=A0AAD4NNP7_9BILA|nr:protein-tyrosine phosphatase domain-containing protein [Ditylenchus destructor]